MLKITRDEATLWYRRMLLLRRFEEKCAELYNATKIRGFLHLYIGEEPVAVGAIGFGPERRDIIRRAFHQDNHHAEEHTGFNSSPALLPRSLDNLGSMGGGRDINVLRNHSQQIIAHRAADNIRFVPRLPQGVQDSPRFLDDPRPPSSFGFTKTVRHVRRIPLQNIRLCPSVGRNNPLDGKL